MSSFDFASAIAGIKTVIEAHPNLDEIIAGYTQNADPYHHQKRNTHDSMENIELIVTNKDYLKELAEYVWGKELVSQLWGANGFSVSMHNDKLALSKGQGFQATSAIAFAVFVLVTVGVYRQANKGVIKRPVNDADVELNKIGCASSVRMVQGVLGDLWKDDMTAVHLSVDNYIRMSGCEALTVSTAKTKAWLNKQAQGAKLDLSRYLMKVAGDVGAYRTLISHALVAYSIAKENNSIAVITDKSAFEKLQPYMTLEIPTNLYLVDLENGFNYFNYFHSTGEVAFALELISAALGKNLSVEYGEDCKIWFENQNLTLNKTGVYDERDRRLNGLLIKSGGALSLVNGMGALLVGVLSNAGILGNGETKSVGELYRTLSDELQWDSEEESGGMDEGDRAFYNFYTTSEYNWNGALPIKFVNGKVALANEVKTLSEYSGTKSELDCEAFHKYNLVRMHKGRMPFINGALATFRMDLVPTKYQDEVLGAVIKLSGHDDLIKGLRSLFPECETWEDNDLIRLAKERVCLGLSTKLAKITKRVGLAYAKHAEAIGGEERAFRVYGQSDVFGYSTGHTINVAFLERAIAAPGLAFWIGDERLIIANRRSTTEVFDMFDVALKSPSGEALFGCLVEGGVLTHDLRKGHKLTFNVETPIGAHLVQGIYLEQDHAVFRVPFKVGDKVHTRFITMPEAGLLREIRWSTNNFGELLIKVIYATLEDEFKWRNGIKCMVAETMLGAGTLYNSLNKNLPSGVQAIIPGDGIKSKDVAWRDLDMMFQTIKHLPKGNTLVGLFNQVCGLDDNIGVNFSPIAALFGLYDSLIKEFVNQYGRGVWLQYETDEAQYTALSSLYLNKVEANKGWARVDLNKIDPISGQSFAQAFGKGALVIANGDELDEHVDVLVFYEQKQGDVIKFCWWQRTFGFVGNQETGCVKLNVKTEISTVAQAVGTTSLMSSVARCVATGIAGVEGDKEGAMRLMADGMPMVYKYMALQSAIKRLPICNEQGEQLPIIKVFDKGAFSEDFKYVLEVIKPEIKELAKQGALTLDALTEELKEVVFDMGGMTPYLWLPCVTALDVVGTSKATLSGAVRAFWEYVLLGIEVIKLSKSVSRISSLMRVLSESKSFRKKILQGRKSAQAKAVGIGGVPIDELWVLKTGRAYPNSLYRQLKKVFVMQGVEDINGQKVIVSRSPMPFPAVLKVRVVHGNDWRAFAVSPHVFAINPLANSPLASDYDGDGYSVCPAQDINLPLLDLRTALASITDRTGIGALDVEQECYISDHYEIKKYKPYALLSDENITMTIREGAKARKGMVLMLKTSTDLQQIMVGSTHELAYTSELGVHINLCCANLIKGLGAEAAELPEWMGDINMLLSGYELYENPLGGLNWDVMDVLEHFMALMYERTQSPAYSVDLKQIEEWLDKGGLNASKTGAFENIAGFVGKHRKDAKEGIKSISSLGEFIGVAAELSFLLGRGKFEPKFKKDGKPNAHLSLAVQYLQWQPVTRAAMCQECVGINMLETYMVKVLPIVCPGVKKLADSVEQFPCVNASILLG